MINAVLFYGLDNFIAAFSGPAVLYDVYESCFDVPRLSANCPSVCDEHVSLFRLFIINMRNCVAVRASVSCVDHFRIQ